MVHASDMEDGYINAVEDALDDCAISPLRADALRKIFAELRRARAAETDAVAEAERWQGRYKAQCEMLDAALDVALDAIIERGDDDE